MKVLFTLLAAALLLWSCQKEIEGLGSNGTTNPATKCTGCSYLPVCDSARLRYVDSSAAGLDTLSSTLSILGDTSINGRKFFRVSPFAGFPQGLLYNCDGGSYRIFQPVPNLGIDVDSLLQALGFPGGNVTVPAQIETTILKSGANAGATWSDTVLQFSPIPLITAVVKLDYKIEEKGVQRTVAGKTYNNVIHVSSTLTVSIPLSPPVPLGISLDTWYADGTGIVESRTTNNGAIQNRLYLLP